MLKRIIIPIVSPKTTALTFGILVICFAVAFYVIAWQEPSQSPPGGNVSAPINVGSEPQSKEGRISAPEFGDSDNPDYYMNPSGQSALKTLCLGANCRDTWPEVGSDITYVMYASSYRVGDTYYAKTVSYSCPGGGSAVAIYCKQILVNGGDGNDFDACSCSTGGSTATLKAYAIRRTSCESYYGSWWAKSRVNSCTPYSTNSCDHECSTAGPCIIKFRCGLEITVGN